MKTFIRVVEVWRPSADGHLLELADGLFDAAPAFGALSRGMCFARGEGLPGHAWDEGRPLLLRRLEGSYFRRAAAASAAGLACAVAVPVFREAALSSVVVMLCGTGDEHAGAIELWHNDPRITSDLRLADGLFGAGAAELEALSRDSYLPRGSGLPGLAWQRDAAVFIDSLGESRHFLRTQSAAHAGIVSGLALPCSSATHQATHQTWVLSLLSSRRTPIARRVESWLPGDRPGALQRGFGHCEQAGSLNTGAATAADPAALGVVGLAWADGVARVARGPGAAGEALDAERQAAGLHALVAIPVMNEGGVGEVIALHF